MLLPVNFGRLSTFSQPHEAGMPEVVVRGPFEELEQSDEGRFEPAAVGHLRRGKSLPPAAAVGLRQVRKWALVDFQPLELFEQLLT